jgi:hypothetical protein
MRDEDLHNLYFALKITRFCTSMNIGWTGHAESVTSVTERETHAGFWDGCRYSGSLRAGRSRNQVPVRAWFSEPVHTGPAAHPACQVSFPGVAERPRSDTDNQPPSRAVYSPSGLSWPFLGWTSVFLGAFENCGRRIFVSSCVSADLPHSLPARPPDCFSVWPHGTTRIPLEKFSRKLISEYFSKICQENSSYTKIWQQQQRVLYVKANIH